MENALIEFTKFCCVENALIEFSAPSWGVIMQLAEFFVFFTFVVVICCILSVEMAVLQFFGFVFTHPGSTACWFGLCTGRVG